VKRRFLLAKGSSLMRIQAAFWADHYIFPCIVSRWTMITSRRIVQGLCRIVFVMIFSKKSAAFLQIMLSSGRRKSGNRFSARIPHYTFGMDHVDHFGWIQSKIMNVI
jgi:hypothetical protein